jgi:hypothetical protein
VPVRPPLAGVTIATLGQAIFGTDVALPPDRFAEVTDYDAALATFEADPHVRVLFENGAGAAPGAPEPSFEAGFAAWPIPDTEATAWYLAADGALAAEPPATEAADSYRYDPSRAHVTTFEGSDDGVWKALPEWSWPEPVGGAAAVYETEPLSAPIVMAGNGSVDLWLRSTGSDVDVQVTLTEVRPDGEESYVQTGWLRASHRALADDATELRPKHSHTEADAAPLPAGEYAEARVELFPFAHVFRAGSKVRIVVEAPGASRPRWTFEALPADGDQTVTLARGGAHASRVVLPVVPGIEVTAPLPPCPSLRGQPCRAYEPYRNGSD